MTAKEYQDRGYRLSLQVAQAEIDRAERDVLSAYIRSVYPAGDDLTAEQLLTAIASGYDYNAESVQGYVCHAFMAFVVLLLAQRSGIATRSGAKVPNALTAQTPTAFDTIGQYGRDAWMYMRRVMDATMDGMDDTARKAYRIRLSGMTDICGILFSSNFMFN